MEKKNYLLVKNRFNKEIVYINYDQASGFKFNPINRKEGDMLYSGSFVISGKCFCRVDRVGINSYSSKITKEAKYIKKVNSEIMKTLGNND